MPVDPFTNARPYYDPTFPSSGDGFSIPGTKNALQGLGFMDFLPLQPRAHSPADMKIMVRGRDASSFYNPIYASDNNTRIFFNSGDSPTMSAPASNPRLDIVYLTPSGDIRIQTGTEGITPGLPSLSPSGDRLPICAVYHKTTETRIVNFEDRNSNTGDGYIYQDLRPHFYSLSAQTTLTLVTPLSVTGDNVVGSGTAAARQDHKHQGVHTIKCVASGDLYGDVELFGSALRQEGNRISLGGVVGFGHFQTADNLVGSLTTPFDNTPPLITEGNEFLALIYSPKAINNYMKVTVSMNPYEPTNTGNYCTIALYANQTLIKAVNSNVAQENLSPEPSCFIAIVSVTSLNAIRFSVRVGNDTGDIGMNGAGAAGLYGGLALTSNIIVEEIQA